MSEPKPIGDEELFARLMANFADFGEWRIRKAAMRGSVLPPMVATLRGEGGTVEVWGGRAHRTEVWVIGRDKSELMVASSCSSLDGSLRLAIATACKLAGVGPRLF